MPPLAPDVTGPPALGDGDRKLHAAAAEADDGANEVTRAGACERDGGPAAGVAPLPEQV